MPWCCSKRDLRPFEDRDVSSTDGFRLRRPSGAAATGRDPSRRSGGTRCRWWRCCDGASADRLVGRLEQVDASSVPPGRGASTDQGVISSMKRMALAVFGTSCLSTAFRRCSVALILGAASSAPMSRERCRPGRRSGCRAPAFDDP